MSPASARTVHVASVLAGVTGLVYAWQRYLYSPGEAPEDPALAPGWSSVHPWQDEVRALHLLSAPLLVFALGLIWNGHVWPRARSGWRPRRRTGVGLALLAAPMCLSGVLLQVSEAELWRGVWMWTHGVTGGAWVLAYSAHLVAHRVSPNGASPRTVPAE